MGDLVVALIGVCAIYLTTEFVMKLKRGSPMLGRDLPWIVFMTGLWVGIVVLLTDASLMWTIFFVLLTLGALVIAKPSWPPFSDPR